MSEFNRPPPPFAWAQPYNPAGSVTGADPNGLGGALAPLAVMFMQQMAGPTNFLPHQNPAQSAMDQLAMRQYFAATQTNTAAAAAAGNQRAAGFVGGMMSLGTNQPLTDLNRQHAQFIGGALNNQFVKAAAGSVFGPENVEALMFGTKGDPSALAAATNRIGYYRPDPATGATRIGGQSLADFTKSVYSTLYEPAGNIDEMVTGAQAKKADHTVRLKKAAKADAETIVYDDEVATRMQENVGEERLGQLYKKYRGNGKATTATQQAQELAQIHRAVKETGVLGFGETTIGNLRERAENAAVEGMYGFSAGKAGQITEHLFQRGMLPQSIGALTPAERVKAIAATGPMDDETKTRLATEFGRRDLEANDEKYKKASATERETMLADRLPSYKERIDKSMEAIRTRQASADAGTPIGAEEANKLLSAGGMSQVSANVDASRVGQTTKKHAEALAAIREIFGDNGNPNAPVPALLAALDHLSQGAVNRTGNVSKIAGTLRSMRTMAKEMGMGIDQMVNMASRMDAYGNQLGLSREQTLNATQNAMSMVNSMDRAGAFSNPKFGTMTKEEAQQFAEGAAARAESSPMALGAAAIRRMVSENREKYAGTELGDLADKLGDSNWDGKYETTIDGKKVTRDFFKDAAEDMNLVMNRAAANSGADARILHGHTADFMTREHAVKEIGERGFRADMQKVVNNSTVRNMLSFGLSQAKTGGRTGKLDTEAGAAGREAASRRLTEMIFETSELDAPEQLQKISDEIEGEFARVLESEGNFSPAEARAEAKRLSESTFGTGKDRKDRISHMLSAANTRVAESMRGQVKSVRGIQGFLRHGADPIAQNNARIDAVAERAHQLGTAYQGTSLERFSDEITRRTAEGGRIDLQDLAFATAGIKPNSELAQRLTADHKGLSDEMAAASQQKYKAEVTEKYLTDLASGNAKDYAGNAIKGAERIDAELRKLVTRDMTDEQKKQFSSVFGTLVTDEAIAKKRQEKFAALTPEKLKEAYQSATGGKGKATTEADMRRELETDYSVLGHNTEVAGFRTEDLLGKGEYVQSHLVEAARQKSLGRHKLDSAEWEREYDRGVARFVGTFGGSDVEVRKGLRAALESDSESGGYATDEFKELTAKLMNVGVIDPKEKDAEKIVKQRAEFEKLLAASTLTPEQRTRISATFDAFNEGYRREIATHLNAGASMPQGPGAGVGVPTPDAAQAAAAGVPTPAPAPGNPAGTTAPAAAAASDKPVSAGDTEQLTQNDIRRMAVFRDNAKLVAGQGGEHGERMVAKGVAGLAIRAAAEEAGLIKPGEEYKYEAGSGGKSYINGKYLDPKAIKKHEEELHKQLRESPESILSPAARRHMEAAGTIPRAGVPENADKPGKPTPPVVPESAPAPGNPAGEEKKTPPHPGDARAAEELKTGKGDPAQATAAATARQAIDAFTGKVDYAAGETLVPYSYVDDGAGGMKQVPDYDAAQQNFDATGKSGLTGPAEDLFQERLRQSGKHPGSPAAGKEVAKGGKSDNKALAQARDNFDNSGPSAEGKAEAAAQAAQEAKGPGASTAANAAQSAGTPTTPATPGQEAPTPTPTQGAGGGRQESLSADIDKLATTIKGLEKPFNDLIAAMAGRGGKGAAAPKDGTDKSDRQQVAREQRTFLQNTAIHQKSSDSSGGGGGGGGGGGQVRGTLTLVGLNAALVSLRGSPVFTPTGDGPSIIATTAGSSYLSDSAVSPIV